jgi:hypothetical protein
MNLRREWQRKVPDEAEEALLFATETEELADDRAIEAKV